MNLTYKIRTFALAGMMLLGAGACTDEFEEMNKNPTTITEVEAGSLLGYNQLSVSGHRYEAWRSNLLHFSVWGQHMHTPWGTANYVTNDGWIVAYWDRSYVKLLANTQEIIRLTQDKPSENAIAKVWRAFIVHRLTDVWGDVPFTEAGVGISQGIFQPKYDTQESIYNTLLSDLKEAASVLSSGSNSYGEQDFLYKGDHAQWKKFANSLRLRLAIRISEVAPSLAQQHASEAIAGGVMESNADIAKMIHVDGAQFDAGTNGTSAPIVAGFNGNYLSKGLVDLMNNTNDPRLPIYGKPNKDGIFIGVPNGTATVDNLSPDNYSVPNENTLFAMDADAIFLSYAEVLFLKAEAAQRGWTSGSAKDYYEAGVRASLEQHGLGDQANAFLAKVPFDSSKALEQICTQKWLAVYGDGFEGYAEIRRSGFPNLPADAVNGEIAKRVRYPQSEQSTNGASYTAAVARLANGDTEKSPVWWDVN